VKNKVFGGVTGIFDPLTCRVKSREHTGEVLVGSPFTMIDRPRRGSSGISPVGTVLRGRFRFRANPGVMAGVVETATPAMTAGGRRVVNLAPVGVSDSGLPFPPVFD
jgi:hypothetical protein